MPELTGLALAHPFWLWLAVGALFLVGELVTGSGWLLWPAGSALLTGIVSLAAPVAEPWSWVVFAAFTVATTFLGRRFLPRRIEQAGPDINDQSKRLIGLIGTVTSDFDKDTGRVLVDGTEWHARSDGIDLKSGSSIRVISLVGTTLKVEPL
jgi:membrane protein implicated in regulation of membrane protease activity